MKYYIKPMLCFIEEELSVFANEIQHMPPLAIQDGISSCEYVMAGKYPTLNWGLERAELSIYKDKAVLETFGKFVAELPTIEVRNMLKDYLARLEEFEHEEKRKN